MTYLGGKARQAKFILEAALGFRPEADTWVEPFMGGAWVTVEATKHDQLERIVANDVYPDLVMLYAACLAGWRPPWDLTREQYAELRKDPIPSPLRGWAAYGCSFRGKRFGGYSSPDYIASGWRSLDRKARAMQGLIELRCGSYADLDIPDGALVYCDPPYANTTGYGVGFDHDAFWAWAEEVNTRATVLVTEYTAPDGWEPLYQWDRDATVDHASIKCDVESLYVRF